MISVIEANSEFQRMRVAGLFREYIDWMQSRYGQEPQKLDAYFDPDAFEAEIASLPGQFAAPDGALLIAHCRARAAGCAGLRRIDAHTCEVKRLFVRPEFHRAGIGRALVDGLIGRATASGYSAIRLDTGDRQMEAQKLYRSHGFRNISPYSETQSGMPWLQCMEYRILPAAA